MTAATPSSRHDRLSSLFLQACELPGDERDAFLRQACPDDPELLQEILELLPYDDQQAIVDRPLIRITGPGGLNSDESPAEPAERLPQHIGQYEVLDVLGQGGMGWADENAERWVIWA